MMNSNHTSWIALWALVRKDLWLFFRNRRAVAVLFVAPVLIAAFFGALFNPASTRKPTPIPIGLVDLDQSEVSKQVSASLSKDTGLAIQSLTESAATDLVRRGKLRAAIVLPKDFGANAGRHLFRSPSADRGDDKPSIVVHHDPSQSMVLPMVSGLLAQHVMRAVMTSMWQPDGGVARVRAEITQADGKGMSATEQKNLLALFDAVERLNATAGENGQRQNGAAPESSQRTFEFSPPYSLQSRAVTNNATGGRVYNAYAQSFAGMSVQFVLFMGIDFGIALLIARRSGIWKRLRAAPISRATVLGASMLSTAIISMIAFSFVFAVGMLVFGIRIDGSLIGFLSILLATSLFTASFGLLLAAVGGNPESTRGLAILATLVLLMIGGAWVPSFVFPEWLQTASQFLPTHWAIEGLAGMTWRGLDLLTALKSASALLAFSAACIALAMWRFAWEG